MKTERLLIFAVTCFLLCWLVSSCQAGCPCARAEAPVVVSQPDTPTCRGGACERSILKGPVIVKHEPVRNVARVAVAAPVRVTAWFQEHRPVRRALAAPFRWLRGCGCR